MLIYAGFKMLESTLDVFNTTALPYNSWHFIASSIPSRYDHSLCGRMIASNGINLSVYLVTVLPSFVILISYS